MNWLRNILGGGTKAPHPASDSPPELEATLLEAEQMAVLGEELADGNVALAGRHRLGRRPAAALGRSGAPVVLTGIGLPDDGLHAPNEKFNISHYYNGIRTIVRLLDRLAG